MVASEHEPQEPNGSALLIANERRKLTATYLDAGATGFFTTGVVAPIAVAVSVIGSPTGQIPALTLGIGASIFLIASLALHAAARYVLIGLKP